MPIRIQLRSLWLREAQAAKCADLFLLAGLKDAFKKALRKLVSKGRSLLFCCEAGSTSYELYRYIVSQGHECMVVARFG